MPDPDSYLLDPCAVRRAFERAAPAYNGAAVLQQEVARRMLERLSYIKLQPVSVLDAGAGTGYALEGLRERFPAARMLALDLALGMLRQARQAEGTFTRLGRRLSGRATGLICADAAALPLTERSQGLIFSNAMLQWCNDPPRVFAEMLRVLEAEGLLMFSTFGPDTLRELREAFAAVDGRPHVSRFLDLHDLGDMLLQAGFADPVMDREVLTLTYDSARDLMRDLKTIGAHNATVGRARGLFGARRWAAMCAELDRFREAGKLPATYEVIYGHAWKPRPNALADGRAIIHFERSPRTALTPFRRKGAGGKTHQ
jgi:malonyl-CoA O-methyltransferase